MQVPAAPILVGLLFDFPQADGGASFEEAVRLGLDEIAATGRLDRPVEFETRLARGLPLGVTIMGRAYSEADLIALAYALEQASRARKAPEFTPTLGR